MYCLQVNKKKLFELCSSITFFALLTGGPAYFPGQRWQALLYTLIRLGSRCSIFSSLPHRVSDFEQFTEKLWAMSGYRGIQYCRSTSPHCAKEGGLLDTDANAIVVDEIEHFFSSCPHGYGNPILNRLRITSYDPGWGTEAGKFEFPFTQSKPSWDQCSISSLPPLPLLASPWLFFK